MINSSTANKIIRELNEERDRLISFERENMKRSYTKDEAIQDLNGYLDNYDFVEHNKKIVALENKIGKLKHAINVFNVNTKLPIKDFDITVDKALVLLPMLSARKRTLENMLNTNNLSRRTLVNGTVEYTEINYNKGEVKRQLKVVNSMINSIQDGIDYVNLAIEFTNPLDT